MQYCVELVLHTSSFGLRAFHFFLIFIDYNESHTRSCCNNIWNNGFSFPLEADWIMTMHILRSICYFILLTLLGDRVIFSHGSSLSFNNKLPDFPSWYTNFVFSILKATAHFRFTCVPLQRLYLFQCFFCHVFCWSRSCGVI